METDRSAHEYTVTYLSNGLERVCVDAGLPEGSDYTVKNCIDAGVSFYNYDLNQWNTRQDGKGEKYNPNDRITIRDDLTLHAMWYSRKKS